HTILGWGSQQQGVPSERDWGGQSHGDHKDLDLAGSVAGALGLLGTLRCCSGGWHGIIRRFDSVMRLGVAAELEGVVVAAAVLVVGWVGEGVERGSLMAFGFGFMAEDSPSS
ncbi:hypothetical protein CYMTET_3155, partial [Cymbomonas tetramitiformis]